MTTPVYLTSVAVGNATASLNPLRTPEGLRAWRLEQGLSQGQLGALLDVKGLTVLRWENGQVKIPRTVELALLWLDQELREQHDMSQHRAETTLSASDDLILSLCREAGQDVDSDAAGTLRLFRAEHDNADIEAAAAGSKIAMIRLRKSCGLRAFR